MNPMIVMGWPMNSRRDHMCDVYRRVQYNTIQGDTDTSHYGAAEPFSVSSGRGALNMASNPLPSGPPSFLTPLMTMPAPLEATLPSAWPRDASRAVPAWPSGERGARCSNEIGIAPRTLRLARIYDHLGGGVVETRMNDE